MPRTDREIFEYMEYYSTREDRKWALENLARVEKKSEEEIRAICEKFKRPRKTEQKPAKAEQKPVKTEQNPAKGKPRGINARLTEEKREEIREALRHGASLSQGAKICGVSSSAVGRIRLEMQANGEQLPEKNAGGRKCTEKYKRISEAYPGQIYDDPEPVVETVEPVVETVEPVSGASESIYKFEDVCTTMPTDPWLNSPTQNEWFAIRDVLSDTALGIFGKGAEITYQAVDCIGGNVSVSVRTADGIDIMFTAERSA